MQALYEDLNSAGLEIVAVEISNDVPRTEQFYEGYGFTIPAGFDVDGGVSRQFGVMNPTRRPPELMYFLSGGKDLPACFRSSGL